MAARLAAAVSGIDGVQLAMPVETNAVFARLSPAAIAELQSQEVFAVWESGNSIVRWMTSFDTTEDDVDRFARKVSALAGAGD
jgi:threonine aldolase